MQFDPNDASIMPAIGFKPLLLPIMNLKLLTLA